MLSSQSSVFPGSCRREGGDGGEAAPEKAALLQRLAFVTGESDVTLVYSARHGTQQRGRPRGAHRQADGKAGPHYFGQP